MNLKEPGRLICPATDIVDDTLYFGVRAVKEDGQEERETLFLVSDKRELIDVEDEETMKAKGLRFKFVPSFSSRWSVESVKKYLYENHTVERGEPYVVLSFSLRKYLELQDPKEYDLVVLWAIGTYLTPVFNSYPYLAISGLKRSGKSKLLTWLEMVCFNAINSANISDPSIYRLVDATRSTILMDEAATLESRERKMDQKTILYSGYKKGAKVYRAEKYGQGTIAPTPFVLYSPKAFVTFKGCEEILADRCIELSMWRGQDPEIVNSNVEEWDGQWQKIKDTLYVWALCYWKEVRELYRQIQGSPPEGLQARYLELWAPILSLARFFGVYDEMLKLAREKVGKSRMEDEEYREQKVIEALVILTKDWGENETREVSAASVRDLVHELLEVAEDRKEMDVRVVSKILARSFGFKSVKRGRKVLRLVNKAEVMDLARRYDVNVEQVLLDEENLVKSYIRQALSAGKSWEEISANAQTNLGSPHEKNFKWLREISEELNKEYHLPDRCPLEEGRDLYGRRECTKFDLSCGVVDPDKCPLKRVKLWKE